MVSYRDLINILRDLGLDTYSRVVVHASLTAFEHVTGGARSLVGALIETCETVIMPAFTTTTMVVPPFGPRDTTGLTTDQRRRRIWRRKFIPRSCRRMRIWD